MYSVALPSSLLVLASPRKPLSIRKGFCATSPPFATDPLPDRGTAVLADYFQVAINRAVQDAFPVLKEFGPLVLRLRTAIIGVVVGPVATRQAKQDSNVTGQHRKGGYRAPIRWLGKRVSGEQIAAAVDHDNLDQLRLSGRPALCERRGTGLPSGPSMDGPHASATFSMIRLSSLPRDTAKPIGVTSLAAGNNAVARIDGSSLASANL